MHFEGDILEHRRQLRRILEYEVVYHNAPIRRRPVSGRTLVVDDRRRLLRYVQVFHNTLNAIEVKLELGSNAGKPSTSDLQRRNNGLPHELPIRLREDSRLHDDDRSRPVIHARPKREKRGREDDNGA